MKLSKSKPNPKPVKRIAFNNYPLKKSNSSSIICSNISASILYNLLKENISIINVKDSKNQTFLSYAIQRNNNEIINLIIASPSLDLSYKDIEGNTYIHLSVIYNNISLIESLIKKGININRKNNDGNTCLHLAYLYNRNKIINLLIDNKADKNIKNNKNKTPEEMRSKNNINNEYFIGNINGDNNNENSELSNSTQLDWVRSAIEVKTKNNEIIKLSLDNDNCFEQNKIKVNKLEKFKEFDNEDTKKLIIRDNYDNDDNNESRYNKYIELDSKMKTSNNIINSDKNSSNKEYIMVSTKASEKIDKNFQYLSNKKNKNIEIAFPDNIKNINDENNEEDIVNMKTTSLFNIKPELNNTSAISKDNVYKKRINMGYLYSKNNLKKSLKPKILDVRNSNNFYQNNSNFNSNIDDEDRFNKTNKDFLSFYSIQNRFNKKPSENNISIANLYKRRIGSECSNLNVNEINNNITTYSKKKINNNANTESNIISYLYKKKDYNSYQNKNNIKFNFTEFSRKKGPVLYTNKEKLIEVENLFSNHINNNKTHSYNKYLNSSKSTINNSKASLPLSKFIKKNISHKFLLSPDEDNNNKSNLLLRNFLSQINMEKYYNILKINGFDNINLLIEQMKSDSPIKDSELKNSGINIPGDRAKILIRLEEKGNLFPFQIPKNVYYIPDEDANINEDENIVKLKRWLKEFKMESYLNNFLENGYYTIELFLLQMISKNPINNDILQNEIGIDKIGHRSRILSILKEECKNIQDKLENKGENVIDIMDEVNNCGCFIM